MDRCPHMEGVSTGPESAAQGEAGRPEALTRHVQDMWVISGCVSFLFTFPAWSFQVPHSEARCDSPQGPLTSPTWCQNLPCVQTGKQTQRASEQSLTQHDPWDQKTPASFGELPSVCLPRGMSGAMPQGWEPPWRPGGLVQVGQAEKASPGPSRAAATGLEWTATLEHTHTYTHTHAQDTAHSYIHVCTHSPQENAHSHTHAHTCTHMPTLTPRRAHTCTCMYACCQMSLGIPSVSGLELGRLSPAGPLPGPDSGKLCGGKWGGESSSWTPDLGWRSSAPASRPVHTCKRQGRPQRTVDPGLIYGGAPTHVSKASC